MAAIIVLLFVLAFAAFQYFKGKFAKSVVMLLTVILANIVAFAFFEIAADSIAALVKDNDGFIALTPAIMFILIFAISLAIFQVIAGFLANKNVEVSYMLDKIGRTVCGAVYGLFFAGIILTTLAIAPLKSGSIPYSRFDGANPDPTQPNKSLLNADGMMAGIFGNVSRGSLSGKNSFNVLHPSILDEYFLNRMALQQDIDLISKKKTISVDKKAAAWLASESLKTNDGTAVTVKSGHELVIVRVNIKKTAAVFSTSQLRLICIERDNVNTPLEGKAVNAYPIGFLSGSNRLVSKNVNSKTEVSGSGKSMDFAFEVPNGYVPSMVAFRHTNIAKVPPLVGEDEVTSAEQRM